MIPPRKNPMQSVNKETLLVKGLNQLSDLHENFSGRVDEFLEGIKEIKEESKKIKSVPIPPYHYISDEGVNHKTPGGVLRPQTNSYYYERRIS